jgi:hypothetical protein
VSVSVKSLRTGHLLFDRGFFPDASTPFESDQTFMHRRRATVLNSAGEGIGRLADVLVAVEDADEDKSRKELLADDLGVGQAESVMLLAILAAIDFGWRPLLRRDRGDPLDLANRFVLCIEPWNVGEGDGSGGNYDFLLPNLLAIAYRHAHLLSEAARNHLLSTLLTQRGPLDLEQHIVTQPGMVYEESENHLLMIEGGRYLTNQLIGFDNDSSLVTTWLMSKLQSTLQNDFTEWNSRPYQGLSVRALAVLYDHAREPVRTATGLVLDYLGVKFAVSSSALRRHVSFRRRREHTWDTGLFEDAESSRFLALTGKARLLREASPDLAVVEKNVAVPAVLSSHRPHLFARDLIMNDNHKTYYQRFRHGGVEVFSSTPDFLISAGGIFVDAFHFIKWGFENISVPEPITIMPGDVATDVRDVPHLDGVETDELKNNTGVAPGFAAGMGPVVPRRYLDARDPRFPGRLLVTDGTKLPRPERHYLIARLATPFFLDYDGGGTMLYAGWISAVPAASMPFETLVANLNASNAAVDFRPGDTCRLEIPLLPSVVFTPMVDLETWPIRRPHGGLEKFVEWPLATGGVMNSEGRTGIVYIDHPILPYMTLAERRMYRISPPAISVRRELDRRHMTAHAGVRELLADLASSGARTNGSLRHTLDVLVRRLTLDFRERFNPSRVPPRLTAREVAFLLGRGLTGDISIREASARGHIALAPGLRAVVRDLDSRFRTGNSLTRGFEAVARRPRPTGPVSLRDCFAYERRVGTPVLRLSALLSGD